MLQNVTVKYVKLKEAKPGDVFAGYVGGTYLNQWGKENLTLYKKTGDAWECQILPYSSYIKKNAPYNAGHLALEYGGLVPRGNYNEHFFKITSKPVPEGNAGAVALIAALKEYTQTLAPVGAHTPADIPRVNVAQEDVIF